MDFKTRLRRFYEVHCPAKCADVDNFAVKYKDREKDLFRQLKTKYGPEKWLTNADKTAARNRTMKPVKAPHPLPNTPVDTDEWLNSLLTEEDHKLLAEIDSYGAQDLPQRILDKI